jgi:hypothetical protein
VDSIVVGMLLLLCSVFYFVAGRCIQATSRRVDQKMALWGIPIVFMLRAIGDFKYIGFFKQVKGTGFASLDTLFFSPLCLFIALAGFLLVSRG